MNNFKQDLIKNNIILNDSAFDKFESFYELLITENEKTNLTRIVEKNDVYYLHFFDSLMVLKGMDLNSSKIKLLDVGAGPGFPSIPLKIALPNLDLTIVEATNKKIEFIKKTIDVLKLENVNPLHLRGEDFKEKNQYDYVTTRAVSLIKEQLPYTIPFLKIGGSLIAMKGENRATEEIDDAKALLKEIGAKVDKIIPYTVLDRKYCLVIIKKIKPTPNKYPISIHKEK